MSYHELRKLADEIPLVADRALVEIVNSIETAEHLTEYRRSRGFFGVLLDRLGGSDRRRETEATAALTRAQRNLTEWVTEFGGHLAFTNLNVAILAAEVEELRSENGQSGAVARQALTEISELAGIVGTFMEHTGRRLAAVEERLGRQEAALDTFRLETTRQILEMRLWQLAWDDTDRVMRDWRYRRTYGRLPWVCQVVLLARQVAGGKAGEHETATGDGTWRRRLGDHILGHAHTVEAYTRMDWQGRRSLAEILAYTVSDLPGLEMRRMVAELLGWGLHDGLRLPHRTLGFAIARIMQYGADGAVTDESAREPYADAVGAWEELAQQAITEAVRACDKYINDAFTHQEFVRHAIDEQADAAHEARLRVRKLLPGEIPVAPPTLRFTPASEAEAESEAG